MPELIAAGGVLLASLCLSFHALTAADRRFYRDIAAMDARLGLAPEFQWKGGKNQ